MRILLVNDDGIDAPPYLALAKALSREHAIIPVAPSGQRSAASHSLTLTGALWAHPVELFPGVTGYAVDGTPADCVRLAFDGLVDGPVDLTISGPNPGWNVAFDALYSGTVAAAMEAAMHGGKSIALSMPPEADPEQGVELFLRLFRQLDVQRDIEHVLSVNLPDPAQVKGVRWVPQGLHHQWEDHYLPEGEKDGSTLYQVHGTEIPRSPEPTDDSSAVILGYAALTPLSFRLTDDKGFREKNFVL